MGYEVDFEWLVKNLRNGNRFTDREANLKIFSRVREREEEMVFDPNESWGEMIQNVLNFDEPRLVPRKSLPKDYDERQTWFFKLKELVNWRNRNYLVKRKRQKAKRAQGKSGQEFDLEA